MKTTTKALLALLSTVILWAFMVVIARALVESVSSVYLLFLRLLIAAIIFLPFFIIKKPWKKKYFKKLMFISLGSTINLTFFMLGIQFTTASTSQIIYAAIPIIVLAIGSFFHKEKNSFSKITGVVLGFTGLLLIVYLSAVEKGQTITGSLLGNMLIFIAMSGWTWYLFSSKGISKFFSPIEIGSTTIIVSFLVSIVVMMINLSISPMIFDISLVTFLGTFYMGFCGTFLTYILYQYAVRHLSSLTVSLTSYIQPISTTLLAVIFLNEKLTKSFIFGGILVLTGVFLCSPVINQMRKKL